MDVDELNAVAQDPVHDCLVDDQSDEEAGFEMMDASATSTPPSTFVIMDEISIVAEEGLDLVDGRIERLKTQHE